MTSHSPRQKLEFLCKELVASELRYVKQLQAFTKFVVEPVTNSRQFNEEQLLSVSGNIQDILRFHLRLYEEFQCAFPYQEDEPTPEHAEAAMVRLIEVVSNLHEFPDSEMSKIYRKYISYWPGSSRLLTNITAPERAAMNCLSKNMKAVNEHIGCAIGNTLEAFTILPIQRPPRYELFIRSMIKAIPSLAFVDFDDFPSSLAKLDAKAPTIQRLLLVTADRITGLCYLINDAARSVEKIRVMTSAQMVCQGFDLMNKPRTLILSGILEKRKLNSRISIVTSLRQFFLFNDILLWTEDKKYKRHINLMPQLVVQPDAKENAKYPGFTILVPRELLAQCECTKDASDLRAGSREGDGNLVPVLSLASHGDERSGRSPAQDAILWIEALQRVIASLAPSHEQPPTPSAMPQTEAGEVPTVPTTRHVKRHSVLSTIPLNEEGGRQLAADSARGFQMRYENATEGDLDGTKRDATASDAADMLEDKENVTPLHFSQPSRLSSEPYKAKEDSQAQHGLPDDKFNRFTLASSFTSQLADVQQFIEQIQRSLDEIRTREQQSRESLQAARMRLANAMQVANVSMTQAGSPLPRSLPRV